MEQIIDIGEYVDIRTRNRQVFLFSSSLRTRIMVQFNRFPDGMTASSPNEQAFFSLATEI